MKTRNDVSIEQLNPNEELVRKLHERLMTEAVNQIKESIGSGPHPTIANQTSGQTEDNPESVAPATSSNEHGGPDKINEIRNEVAANQPPDIILNPDKQNEILEIVKQKNEEFERELISLASNDKSIIDSESERFKNELTENVSKLLTESNGVAQPMKSSDANHIQNETHQ